MYFVGCLIVRGDILVPGRTDIAQGIDVGKGTVATETFFTSTVVAPGVDNGLRWKIWNIASDTRTEQET